MPLEPNPSDRPDLLNVRKDQEDPVILYLIVRESLNMGPGKIAAQVGHAVGMLMGAFHRIKLDKYGEISQDLDNKYSMVSGWLRHSYRKVVLRADDKEWEKIKSSELYYFLVQDAGLTEVDPGSETVICLWPMLKSKAPKIIKKLQIL